MQVAILFCIINLLLLVKPCYHDMILLMLPFLCILCFRLVISAICVNSRSLELMFLYCNIVRDNTFSLPILLFLSMRKREIFIW